MYWHSGHFRQDIDLQTSLNTSGKGLVIAGPNTLTWDGGLRNLLRISSWQRFHVSINIGTSRNLFCGSSDSALHWLELCVGLFVRKSILIGCGKIWLAVKSQIGLSDWNQSFWVGSLAHQFLFISRWTREEIIAFVLSWITFYNGFCIVYS